MVTRIMISYYLRPFIVRLQVGCGQRKDPYLQFLLYSVYFKAMLSTFVKDKQ